MWLQFTALLAHIQCLVVSRSKIRKYVCKLLLEMQIYNHRVVRCVCVCVLSVCVCVRINTFNTHTMWRVGWENTGNLSVARWRPRHGSCQFKAATHTQTHTHRLRSDWHAGRAALKRFLLTGLKSVCWKGCVRSPRQLLAHSEGAGITHSTSVMTG